MEIKFTPLDKIFTAAECANLSAGTVAWEQPWQPSDPTASPLPRTWGDLGPQQQADLRNALQRGLPFAAALDNVGIPYHKVAAPVTEPEAPATPTEPGTGEGTGEDDPVN